jgi:hypothetical protein
MKPRDLQNAISSGNYPLMELCSLHAAPAAKSPRTNLPLAKSWLFFLLSAFK